MSWLNELLRFVCAVGSATVCLFALVRMRVRIGSKRWALIALGTYAGASTVSQLTLLHTGLTIRTWMTALATLAGLTYVCITARQPKD